MSVPDGDAGLSTREFCSFAERVVGIYNEGQFPESRGMGDLYPGKWAKPEAKS
jgi:hypothetical protein